MRIKGRVWKFGDHINTDDIIPARYLNTTDEKELASHCFETIKPEFPEKVREGDIIVAGENFGCGSSRQHAVDCFIALGIKAIVAKSFGAIYKRNAINSGLAIVECGDIDKAGLKNGDVIEIDLEIGEIKKDNDVIAKAKPMNPIQSAIYRAGDLFSYAKSI